MTEQNYPAGPAMVKIDGTRVRAIREQKGLTQLYVATVVEVTTDTVSRWENGKQRIGEGDLPVTTLLEVSARRLHVAKPAVGQCELIVDDRCLGLQFEGT